MAGTPLPTTPQALLVFNLLHAAATVERQVSRRLVHGLSLPELQLLLYIRQHDGGPMRRGELAECLGMSQSSATRLLGPLERRGIVQRLPDPNDARASLTQLTSWGAEVVAEVLTAAEEAAEDAVAGFTAEELASAEEFLGGLLAGVRGGFHAPQTA